VTVVELAPDAWLLHTLRPLALAAALPREGLEEIVPGADCVLVRGPRAREVAANVPREYPDPAPRAIIELPATFDGEDLDDVAVACGLARTAVIDGLRSSTFTVAFCGFAPGFGYLTGLPPRLHLPRRSRPRPRVPAGAIAMAAGYCAVYPTESPGGWHLIGHCDTILFDADRTPPALLEPGATVRFV
jgi:KipI family sensor histidine kinase inhibitor